MKSISKHTSQSFDERLRGLERRGEKHAKKGIQYDPHDLPKNALLRFSLFAQMKHPLLFVHHIDSVLFDFPIPSEHVPLCMLREVIIHATKTPNIIVFILTSLRIPFSDETSFVSFSGESSNSCAYSSLRNRPKYNLTHSNLIVYNKSAKRIEVFDPIGTEYGDYFTEQKDLQNSIICDAIKDIDKDIKFFPETLARGIQCYDKAIHIKREGSGFCAIWTCLIAKLCVENPSKSMREIVAEITETRQQCSTNICRGFLDEMREVAFDLMRKKHGKFAKQYLELIREPPNGNGKSSYRASEMATMEYLRGMC